MSMIEHAVGVVSLERFAEISHMSHDEMGSLLLDTMAENTKLRELVVRMFHTIEWSDRMSDSTYWPSFSYERELRELGIEV